MFNFAQQKTKTRQNEITYSPFEIYYLREDGEKEEDNHQSNSDQSSDSFLGTFYKIKRK